ncbi:hypothetical protein MBLNU457_4077t1 [Dothideomycetes sp. NU457]
MAEYKFTWPHQANEVFVTGTFDNWSKSERLERHGDVFSKTVRLPSEDKVLYKFVVDGNWTTDHTAASERDFDGNINNVLYKHDLSSLSTLSSAAPGSSTAALAGQQPLESNRSAPATTHTEESHGHRDLPGAFPETPAVDFGSSEPSYGVAPLPATSGAGNPVNLAPGEKVPEPSSYTDKSVNDNVRLDKESYERGDVGAGEASYGVAPLPATSGAGNPINLAPGEKVPEPSSYTSTGINDNVRLDRETYERGETGAPQLPPVLDKQEEREAAGASMFGLPPVGGTMIPESSLPMGSSASREMDVGPTISSAGPQSTTAQLAGQQPILPRGVPEVVSESQHEAGFNPEAASSTSAVQHKNELEEEIKETVPEVPATSESGPADQSLGQSTDQSTSHGENKDQSTSHGENKDFVGAAAGGLAAVGATAIGAAYMAKDKISEATQSTSAAGSSTGTTSTSTHTSKDPNAILSYEAGATQSEVQQKETLGDELKATVPEAPTTSESGVFGKSEQGMTGAAAGGIAAVGASAAGAAYLARDKIAEATGYAPTSGATTGNTAGTDSASKDPESFISHETGASPSEIHQKEAVADELRNTVPEAPTTSESGMLGKSEQGITGAIGSSAAGAAYTAREKISEATGYPTTSGTGTTHQPESFISHETGASIPEIHQKEAVGDELKATIPEAPVTSESGAFGKGEKGVSATSGNGVVHQPESFISYETGASTSEIQQKEAVGDELKATIPEAPTTSESGTFGKSEKGIAGMAAGGLATAGAAAAGAAYMARDKTAEATGKNPNTMLPESIQRTIDSMNGGATSSTTSAPTTTADTVPAVVSESQHEAHVSPEASASTEAVREKSAMEKELLSEVRPANETGEPAPSQSAALYSAAPTTTSASASEAPKTSLTGASTASTYQPSGLNATATSQAQTPATKIAERATASKVDTVDSTPVTTGTTGNYLSAGADRSEPGSGTVSPMTTGVASSTSPAKSEGAPAPIVPGGDSATRSSATNARTDPSTPQGTPQKKQAFRDTPESTRTSTTAGTSADSPAGDKKGKRKGFFGKLKDRFKA